MVRAGAFLALALCAATCSGAGAGLLSREYEYEEELYLATDGSADIIVNGSIASLNALHGLSIASAAGDVDRDHVRALYESPVTRVTRVSRPWERHGRTFVQVRVETDDVTTLSGVSPFSWSTYAFERSAGEVEGQTLITYRQRVSRSPRSARISESHGATTPPALRTGQRAAVEPTGSATPVSGSVTGADVRWLGDELVAVRLHLPSKIAFHNAPSKRVERGNIVSWEQPLAQRLAGEPIDIEVRMDGQSILYTTLGIFGSTLAAALLVLAAAAYWVKKKGRDRPRLFTRQAS